MTPEEQKKKGVVPSSNTVPGLGVPGQAVSNFINGGASPVIPAVGTPVPENPVANGATPYKPAYSAQSDPAVMAGQVGNVVKAATPNIQAVATGSDEDVRSAFGAGNYGAAFGNAIRGAVTMPVAAVADAASALSPVVGGVVDGTKALFGIGSGEAAPVVPAVQAGVTPADKRLAAGTQRPVGGVVDGPSSGIPVSTTAGAPGSTITVAGRDAAGKPNSFSGSNISGGVSYANPDGSAAGFGVRNGVSAQNDAAASALSDRYAVAPAAATANPVTVLPDTGGYGVRDKSYLAAREAAMSGGGRISGREAARLDNARTIAAENNATSRVNNQESNATQVAGQQTSAASSKYGVDKQAATAAAAQAHAAVGDNIKNAEAIAAMKARNAYGAALESGDPKRIKTAENNLRAIQGKYEKDDVFTTTAIPAGVDPVTGMPRGAGAIVTDRRDGSVRIISADQAQGGQQGPALPPGMVKQVGTANGKPVYEDKSGKRFTGN